MVKKIIKYFIVCLVGLGTESPSHAHVGSHPSVHDTVAGIVLRLTHKYSLEDIQSLSVSQLLQELTEEEKHVLSTEHLSFTVNIPVTVSVIRDIQLKDEPFWLPEQGFQLTDMEVELGENKYDVWQKKFDAGWVGLGVNSLRISQDHYFVTVAPQNAPNKLEIKNLYPAGNKAAILQTGVSAYADLNVPITYLPSSLRGQILIQTLESNRNDAILLNIKSETLHPSSAKPDQIVLTWSDDPRTTQTVQWRTNREVSKAQVAYQKKSDYNRFYPKPLRTVEAKTEVLSTPNIPNDPVVHRHTAVLSGLEPGTTYVYAVSEGINGDWNEMAEFTTAPDKAVPFSFIYMGDAQNGLDRWGTLVHRAFLERPDAAFYIMAGDLINVGNDRWDWDDLFYNARDIYDRRTLVPVIGNHECQGGHPSLYLKLFHLPGNGPSTIEAERAYSFEYSNALFVVLDSNLDPAAQTEWLEEQLAKSTATWKFVTYHHPAYSSAPNRDNIELRTAWGPLFDKYHVDMALQGHDHAYLRTFPMKNNQRVDSPKDGTVYIVSVSGTKMYDQDPREYTEFGMTNVPTYQVLDIQIEGDRLVYRAYDIDGDLRDEIIIDKSENPIPKP